MGKSLFIAEKPSVAQEFAKALHENFLRKDGFQESNQYIVTWCVGHLVTMSYPEAYDPKLKQWRFDTLPFLPKEFKYEIIPSVQKQFEIVKQLLTREDVETIYVCTDSGREGEYIYRLVGQMAGVKNKKEKRVWIDSQTEEEILKGIHTAKDLSEYDNLSAAAYLRAKEDYLMGINFSRILTLKYGRDISNYLKADRTVVSVGRVMTCVLGMVVKREREIRSFEKTSFYRVLGTAVLDNDIENQSTKEVDSFATATDQSTEAFDQPQKKSDAPDLTFDAEWRVSDKSRYAGTPYLYKENGFIEREKAEELQAFLSDPLPADGIVENLERKKEMKNPPLLYNLAELQNECSKLFKISPDQTLNIIQELYEKKLVTYPRTDARVLSTAVCKEIHKNISGLKAYMPVQTFADEILTNKLMNGIEKTRYCDDKKITDHYAIIPTGQGLHNLKNLSSTSAKTFEIIVRRFLSIFYPAAKYSKVSITLNVKNELLYSSFKMLIDPGFLKITQYSFSKSKANDGDDENSDEKNSTGLAEALKKYKKGDKIKIRSFDIKEGETSPPKRYNSGSMILAMENAGQLIEDEELRAQIKGSGIGTSATRAEILKKLHTNQYIAINKKTQIITPTLLGEIINDVVASSIHQLLNPELTASWEKGLNYVAEGTISPQDYMEKLEGFVYRRTEAVKKTRNQAQLVTLFNDAAKNYK